MESSAPAYIGPNVGPSSPVRHERYEQQQQQQQQPSTPSSQRGKRRGKTMKKKRKKGATGRRQRSNTTGRKKKGTVGKGKRDVLEQWKGDADADDAEKERVARLLDARQQRVVEYAPGYIIEGGGLNDDELEEFAPLKESDVIDDVWDITGKDNDAKFYADHFKAGMHTNLLCNHLPGVGPVCVSVMNAGDMYVAMVRTQTGTEHKEVPSDLVEVGFMRKMLKKSPDARALLRAVCPSYDPKPFRAFSSDQLHEKILKLEERQAIQGFKFGLVYAEPGQTKEEDMLHNTTGSPAFEEFMDFLGERISLYGWGKFRAGLDTKNNSTGQQALWTVYENNPIMYHVSTLLPFTPNQKQQLERKRHIGNDLVVIIFQEGDTVYRPTCVSSRMVHCVILVKPVQSPKQDDPDARYYRIAAISREGVPPCAPLLPNVSTHKKSPEFRDFLYRKLLNAERACYQAPILANKLSRTRTALLQDLCSEYFK